MLDNPERRTEMSEERANEIINFINGVSDARFCNIRTESELGHLAQMAYHSLGLTIPGSFDQMVQNATKQLGKKHKRIGLDIGEDRARYLVNHLLGKESDAHFRKGDDITIQRELLRKALAKVAKMREQNADDTTHSFIVTGDRIIDEKYPLDIDDINN